MDVEKINKKMGKMNIRVNDKEADEVLSKHKAKDTFTKDQLTITYKTLTDMLKRKKGNEKWVTVDELLEQAKKPKDGVDSMEMLMAILEKLEGDSKLSTENGKIFMT